MAVVPIIITSLWNSFFKTTIFKKSLFLKDLKFVTEYSTTKYLFVILHRLYGCNYKLTFLK